MKRRYSAVIPAQVGCYAVYLDEFVERCEECWTGEIVWSPRKGEHCDNCGARPVEPTAEEVGNSLPRAEASG